MKYKYYNIKKILIINKGINKIIMSNNKSYKTQITIIGILFAVFGFITWLNGILIPFLKKSCELSDMQAYLVTTAFFAAYFFLALPSSWILSKLGTKNGMVVGLLTMTIGCLIFAYAGGQRSFTMFLSALFVLGMGLALLQTAANPYVSLIGPIESAATRISIMGICNKLAGILANLLLGSILLKNSDALQAQIDSTTDIAVKTQLLNDLSSRVQTPYIIMAIFLGIIAFIIKKSSLPDIKEQAGDEEGETELSRNKTSIYQFPHVWLGALAIFMYVGLEVMAGDLITIYGKNLGFTTDTSKFFSAFGLGGLLVGYVVCIAIVPKFISQEKYLTVSAVLGMLLTIGAYLATDKLAVGLLAALGFANAIMWPAIFPLGIRDVGGRFSNIASALLIMGIVGGAIIPPFYGWLYENNVMGLDFRSAFMLVTFICYIYVLWFGLRGHKVGFNK
jgi:MFS transporter, FHS family, L-fucose permease